MTYFSCVQLDETIHALAYGFTDRIYCHVEATSVKLAAQKLKAHFQKKGVSVSTVTVEREAKVQDPAKYVALIR